MKFKILVVVDMQNDFITGALKNDDAVKIVPNVVKKITEYLDENNIVFVTQDTHYDETYMNSPEGKNLPIPHCIKGSDGWKLEKSIDELLHSKEGMVVNFIEKQNFWSDSLATEIKQLSMTAINIMDVEIELIGICTDICVISNAFLLRGVLPDYIKITVDSSCCAGLTPDKHNNALEMMSGCGMEII